MGRVKTVNTGGKLVSFEGSLRVLSETEGLLQRVEVRLLNSLVNRNNWKYLNLDEHRGLFADTPLLVAYKGKQIGDGHNFDEVRNPDGTVTASFMSATAERIVGWFRSDEDIRIETIDNVNWIVGTGYIWKWYAQELVAKLRGQGRGDSDMSVSIETLIDEMHMDGDVEVYTKYQILGTTILGDSVDPAVVDASIRALSAIGTAGIREMTLRVASAVRSHDGDESKDQAEEAAAEPKNKKGKNIMNMKKKKELEGKFPGFRVLAANGDNLALCSVDSDAEYFTASFKEENGEIVTGVKNAADAHLFIGEGENAVEVDFAALRAEDSAKIATLQEQLDKANDERADLAAKIKVMEDRECERRKKAVKDAIAARFHEVCENAGEELDESICAALLTDEKIASYAAMQKEDGEFCGDEVARKDVSDLCMDKLIEAGKNRRANENKKRTYAFEMGANNETSDSLDAYISAYMGE